MVRSTNREECIDQAVHLWKIVETHGLTYFQREGVLTRICNSIKYCDNSIKTVYL
jgi:hypothetical protein